MTEHHHATTTTTTTTSARPNEAGVLENLDPTALVIETNVRTEYLALDAEFVDSVRTHGVLVPALGCRDTDSTVRVRAGQRRTLAGREAGMATIPVYVVQADDDSTARRIVEQPAEDEHRQHLTDADRVAVWQSRCGSGAGGRCRVPTCARRAATRFSNAYLELRQSGPSLNPSLPTSLEAMGLAMGFTRFALSWPATSAVRLLNHPQSAEKRC